MADCRGERVGSVVGSGWLAERQELLNHGRDLLLVCGTLTADRRLDLLWGVAETRYVSLACREHHNASRVPNRERRTNILAEVKVLDRYCLRRVFSDKIGNPLMNQHQSGRKFIGRCGLYHSAVQGHQPAGPRGHHSITGVGSSGINSKDNHWPIVSRTSDAVHCPAKIGSAFGDAIENFWVDLEVRVYCVNVVILLKSLNQSDQGPATILIELNCRRGTVDKL